MEYVILDFEFNGVYSDKLKRYFNEIIDIGAIKVNQDMKIIDEFSVLVRPVVGKNVNKYVQDLTQLTMEELTVNGIPFQKMVSKLKDFISDATLITWGISDMQVLSYNYKYFFGTGNLGFIKRFLNLQSYCEEKLNLGSSQKLGLSTALNSLNIEVDQGKVHQALYDSFLAYECFKRLFNRELVEKYTEDCENSEFYDRLNFKNHIVGNLKELNINIDDAEIFCFICKNKAERISNWKKKNKIYRAEFKCENCKRKFIGKLKFVRTYDGIYVHKSVNLLNEETSEG